MIDEALGFGDQEVIDEVILVQDSDPNSNSFSDEGRNHELSLLFDGHTLNDDERTALMGFLSPTMRKTQQ